MKTVIVALFGPSGAGKSFLVNEVCKISEKSYSPRERINKIIPVTTRPKREGETDGDPYYFTTVPEFTSKLLDHSLIEATEFNGWFYGTDKNYIKENAINIGAFNPSAIECLLEDKNYVVLPFYIKTNDKKRLMSALRREEDPNCKEICRRFLADEKDFLNIDFEYFSFFNNFIYKSAGKLYNEILECIK